MLPLKKLKIIAAPAITHANYLSIIPKPLSAIIKKNNKNTAESPEQVRQKINALLQEHGYQRISHSSVPQPSNANQNKAKGKKNGWLPAAVHAQHHAEMKTLLYGLSIFEKNRQNPEPTISNPVLNLANTNEVEPSDPFASNHFLFTPYPLSTSDQDTAVTETLSINTHPYRGVA